MARPLELQARDLICTFMEQLDITDISPEGQVSVFKRGIASTDPNFSICVFFQVWEPGDYNIGQEFPVYEKFMIAIQTYCKSSDRDEGEEFNALLTKKVRDILYRDQTLRVQLAALREGEPPNFKRVLRLNVNRTEYADVPVDRAFAFLAQTDTLLEIEQS